jgi:hypothetical protein
MKKKITVFMGCIFLAGALYNLWTLRQVNIMFIYSDAGSTINIVVDHLPWTDRDKIEWFLARKKDILEKHPLYNNSWHDFLIMDIGDGFTNFSENPDEDLFCFPTIKSEKNCLVKNYLLVVEEAEYENMQFHIAPWWTSYQLTSEGKVERIYMEENL